MNIIRVVLKTDEYERYFQSLDIRTQAKYDYVIELIQTQRVVNAKFVKKNQNTEFYEIRIPVGTNFIFEERQQTI